MSGFVALAGYVSTAGAQSDATRLLINSAVNEQASSQSGPIHPQARKYMVVYDDSELLGIPIGSEIVGLSFRLDNATALSWPTLTTTASSYQIRMGRAASLAAQIGTSFSGNFVGTPVLVRDGALEFAMNAFSASATGSAAEAFGPYVPFEVGGVASRYVYTGGPLAIEITHTGFAGQTERFLDATASNGAFARGLIASSSGANVGSITSGIVCRIAFRAAYIPAAGVGKAYLPREFATTSGDTTTSRVVGTTGPQTLAVLVGTDQTATIAPGSVVRSVTLRNRQGNWPPSGFTLPDYEVRMGRSARTPTQFSVVLSENYGPTLLAGGGFAMDGAAVFAPAQFRVSTPPHFASRVNFQSPREFAGGDWLMTFRTRTPANTGPAAPVFDAVDVGTVPNGAGVRAGWSGSVIEDPVLDPAAFPVMRMDVDAAVVAPGASLETPGTGLFVSPFSQSPRVSQTIIDERELAFIPHGSTIEWIAVRQRGGSAAYPPSELRIGEYSIWLSTATRGPAGMSATFAENEGSDRVQVRGGELRLEPGAVPGPTAGELVNGFGAPIVFNRRGFVYRGGPLCVTIQHSGTFMDSAPLEATEEPGGVRSAFATGILPTATAITPGGLILKVGYSAGATIPASRERLAGGAGQSLLSTPRTYQWMIDGSQLADVPVGSVINGFWLRSAAIGGDDWPTEDRFITNCSVTIASAPYGAASMSGTFATNEGTSPVQARLGALLIGARWLPPRGGPTEPADTRMWVDFQRPFVYEGGGLTITMRTDQGLTGAPLLDTTPAVAGLNARIGSAVNSVTGTAVAEPLIIRLGFTAPPGGPVCPGDLSGDGVVDDLDFVLFTQQYEVFACADPGMPAGCTADLTGDGFVDDLDFTIFAAAYSDFVCP